MDILIPDYSLFVLPDLDAASHHLYMQAKLAPYKNRVCLNNHKGEFKFVKYKMRCSECRREDARNNIARESARKVRYEVRKNGLLHPCADNVEIMSYYARTQTVSIATGIKHHVDHIIPLDSGGIHHESNLQILQESLNCSKGNRTTTGFQGERLMEDNTWSCNWNLSEQIAIVVNLRNEMN